MSTMISTRSSSGESRRCDAKCHDATEEKCDCVCGGINHGVGEKQAADNTKELAERMIETIKQQDPAVQVSLGEQLRQIDLF